jgi:hypothetical protein
MDLAHCSWLQAGGTALVANVLQRAGVRERLADALCADLGLGKGRCCSHQCVVCPALLLMHGSRFWALNGLVVGLGMG